MKPPGRLLLPAVLASLLSGCVLCPQTITVGAITPSNRNFLRTENTLVTVSATYQLKPFMLPISSR